MRRILALACTAVLAAGTVAATANTAAARDWHRGGHHRHWNGGAALGAGILGGMILGQALSGPRYYDPGYACDPYYGCYDRPRVIYREPVYRPRVIYRAAGLSEAHVRWCYNRYRSYRASDNTFQPYNGPRQQCYSPYD